MKIVLIGPPGSGKGSQAKLLADRLGLPHIDVGELFRKEAEAGTELGIKAKAYWERGSLVPDALTIAMVSKRLSAADCTAGWILDGYPRTLAQARALEPFKPDIVLELWVPDDVAIKRISGRLVCQKCGKIYVKGQAKSCCGTELVTRPDDRPEAIAKRLEVYHAQTEPILDYYRQSGLARQINATASIEEVQARVLSELQKAAQKNF